MILTLIQNILGVPPTGYEYLVYKTACILLVGFYTGMFLLIYQFQRSFQRRPK